MPTASHLTRGCRSRLSRWSCCRAGDRSIHATAKPDVPQLKAKTTLSSLGSILGTEDEDEAEDREELVEWWRVKPQQSAAPRQQAMSPGMQGRFIMNEDYFGALRASVATAIGEEVSLPRSVPLASWGTAALAIVVFGTYSNVVAYQGPASGQDFLDGILLDHARVLQDGEAWRLVVALVAHSSALQLASSVWCLAAVATESEALLGNWTFASIFLLSGLSGEVAALASDPAGSTCGPAACLAGVAAALAVQTASARTARQAAEAIAVAAGETGGDVQAGAEAARGRSSTSGASSSSSAPAAASGRQQQGPAGVAGIRGGGGSVAASTALLALHVAGSLALALYASHQQELQQLPAQLQPVSLMVGAAAGAVLAAGVGPAYQVSRELDIPEGSMSIPDGARELLVIVDTRSNTQRALTLAAFAAALWSTASVLLPAGGHPVKKGEKRRRHNRNRLLAMKHMFGPLWKSASNRYKSAVFSELSQYGLRYDDLYDPLKDEDVAEALRRLPPDVLIARNSRLRRAADLDMKHDHLHGELLALQTPGEHYLQTVLEEVRKERRERALLGSQPSWTRIYYD